MATKRQIDRALKALVENERVASAAPSSPLKETVMLTELKPCPFCDAAADPAFQRRRLWQVCCSVCTAEGPSFETKEEAEVAWNRRAASAAPAEGREFASASEIDAEVERLLALKKARWPESASSMLEAYRQRATAPTMSEADALMRIRRKIAAAPHQTRESDVANVYVRWLPQEAVLDILDAAIDRAAAKGESE